MYTGRFFNREQEYLCGDYMSIDIYPVFQNRGTRRKKCKPTRDVQKKLNQRNAAKAFTRIIHANFDETSIALHMTYRNGQEPENAEAAEKDMRGFLKLLRKEYKKEGKILKYVRSTEYGEKNKRCHHHMILTGGIDRDRLEELWAKGYANSKRLQFEDDGVAALAHYVIKDHNRYRRWCSSRNLTKPEPKQTDGAVTMEEIQEMVDAIDRKTASWYFERRHPEFVLVEASYEWNEYNKRPYIRVEMRKRHKWRKGEPTHGRDI